MSAKCYKTCCCTIVACLLAASQLFATGNPVKMKLKGKWAQQLSIGNPVNATESGTYGSLDILLSEGPATEDISITYQITGKAAQGTDYYSGGWTTGSTTLFAGQSSAQLLLGAIDDDLVEGDESVIVTITGATGLNSAAIYALDAKTVDSLQIIDNDNIITAYSITGNQAAEPSSPITAKFSLPGTLTAPQDVTITYFIDGGTAANGVDYETPSGTIILPAGSNYVVLSIPVIDDKIIEGNETMKVTISAATAPDFNLTLSTSRSVSSSILDDDSELSIGIAGTVNGSENPNVSGSFTISLPPGVVANDKDIITINYSISGTATNGVDYKTLTGKAYIAPNKNSIVVPVNMTGFDDKVIEGNETILITLLSGSSGVLATYAISSTANTTTVYIADDDSIPANCQINAIMMADGAESSTDGSFKLALPGTYTFKQDMTVTYAVSGSATAGTDYTTLPGSATLVAGQNSVLVTVPVLNDALIEGDETVIITPNGNTTGGINFTGGTPCTVMIIDDDDDNLKVSISAYDPNGAEPADTAAFRVSLPNGNAASAPVTVTYTIAGTAANGTDYTTLSGSVTIPADSTGAFIPVQVLDDNLVEGDETIKLKLEGVTSSLPFSIDLTKDSAAVTIADDDNVNMDIIVKASVPAGAEPSTPGQFTVSLASGKTTTVPVTVTYTVAGTATSGTDYTALSGTVTIPAGSDSATISVPVLDDNLVEGNEKVVLTLNGVTAALPFVIGAQNQDSVIIDDDDDANMDIVINASIDNAGEPSTNGEFTVSLASGKTTTVPITVTYLVTGTASSGVDYTALSGTVTIPANSAGITFPVPVLNDTIAETNETIIVTLNGLTATMPFVLGAKNKDTVTIIDDDTEQIIISASDAIVAEPADPGMFTIGIASGKPAAADITVNYTVTGTGTNGTDYTSIPVSVVIPTGSVNVTIPVTVLDDDLVEGPETVVITLQEVTSAVLYNLGAQDNANVTIDDDDDANLNVEIVATKADAAEPGDTPETQGEFTIRLASGKTAAQDIDVDYVITGSALNGTDYDTITAKAVIPAGGSSFVIPLIVKDDTKPEGMENVILTLSKLSGALPFTIGANGAATVNISDNDTVTTAAWMNADTQGKTVVSAGDAITYTIHISNGSDTDHVNVIVKDRVPAFTTFVFAEGVRPDASGLLTWTIPLIARGATVTLYVQVRVANDLTGADSIVNTATVDFGDALGEQPVHPADPLNPNFPMLNSDPNAPATVVHVNKSGGFATWKTVRAPNNAAIVKPGEELLYRIYIRNTGGIALSSVTIVDTIPAGTIYVSNATGGIYSSITNTISWTRNVGVGVKDSVSFILKTVDDLTGILQIENTATVSTADSIARTGTCDPATSGCSGLAAITVIPTEQAPPPSAELVFPNVFTPNNDGLNEYFKIAGLESYTNAELYVYNRWGSQVYASKDYHNDWNGANLNEGTYYYVLKAKTSSQEDKLYKGWVQILR